jgi:hypothetical protein
MTSNKRAEYLAKSHFRNRPAQEENNVVVVALECNRES